MMRLVSMVLILVILYGGVSSDDQSGSSLDLEMLQNDLPTNILNYGKHELESIKEYIWF